jgi:hypothetical protein
MTDRLAATVHQLTVRLQMAGAYMMEQYEAEAWRELEAMRLILNSTRERKTHATTGTDPKLAGDALRRSPGKAD